MNPPCMCILQTTMVTNGKNPPFSFVKDKLFVIFPPSIHVEHFVGSCATLSVATKLPLFSNPTQLIIPPYYSRLIVTHHPISSMEL